MKFIYIIGLWSIVMITACTVSQKTQSDETTLRTPKTEKRFLEPDEINSNARTANTAVEQSFLEEVDCIDTKAVKSPALRCPPTKAEVCGCNGVTYKNSCEADKAGVTRFTTGPCGSNVKSTGNSGKTATK